MMMKQLKHKTGTICNFIKDNFASYLHSKQYYSLTNAVLGLLASGKATIANMGRGLAEIQDSAPKHAIKQIDRLLSNDKISITDMQSSVAKYAIGNRESILVAIDWTNFTKDNQATLTAKLITKHGRATPLVWLSVYLDKLFGKKIMYEDILLSRLKSIVGNNVKVIILADREFGSIERFGRLKNQYNFDYVIRFRKNTYVEYDGIYKKADDWLRGRYNARNLSNAKITGKKYKVSKVVIAKDPGMKDKWCLACSIDKISLKTVKKYYNKRWSTECSYRDEKNFYSGFGLYKSRIKSVLRRDRMLAIISIALIILTFLGRVSEKLKLDRQIRANTATYRTHSLFRQGLFLLSNLFRGGTVYENKIFKEFELEVNKHAELNSTFGYI